MRSAINSAPAKTEICNMRDMATPKIAACAVASPKYAIRRQTTKQPSGAAANATPIPASTALVMKSSSTVLYLLMGVIMIVVVMVLI
jgi:hypothetical protein